MSFLDAFLPVPDAGQLHTDPECLDPAWLSSVTRLWEAGQLPVWGAAIPQCGRLLLLHLGLGTRGPQPKSSTWLCPQWLVQELARVIA